MEAIRLQKVIEKDGELLITDLPCKKGQHVEIIVLSEPPVPPPQPLNLPQNGFLDPISLVSGRTEKISLTARLMRGNCAKRLSGDRGSR